MAEREKQSQVQIYLMKESVKSADEALRDVDFEVMSRSLRPPLEGVLLTKRSSTGKPKWAGFLEEGMGEDLPELKSASASAMILLAVRGRWFAVSYGYGRTLLDPSKIERPFGIRVVLNCIDPDQVRSVDSRTVEEMTFHTRRQASRTSDVSAFRLDVARDLLRGVTGTPRDASLASRISGAESVTLSAAITMGELPAKCAQLLEVYAGEQYKERFAWIDNLQLVSDPDELSVLEESLDTALAAGDFERMHLAPPEALDWENVSGFYYWEPDKSERFSDLDITDAIGVISQRSGLPVTADWLRRRHVWVEFREQEDALARYTLHSCLVFEADIDGELYVLSDGDWHRVNRTWADGVRARVNAIRPADDIALPSARPGEVEGDYNERAAAELGAKLLDKCIVRYGPGSDQFEVCDILTQADQLIHVKRKTQSATLSHLFNQGLNSAQMLAYHSDFRLAAQAEGKKKGVDLSREFPAESIRPWDFEVVYAIVAKANANWPNSLPFFSQLSLAEAADSVQRLGYRIALRLIPVEEQAAAKNEAA